MQPVGLQEWIHKIEEGEGTKYVRLAFAFLALLGLTALWHLREARNFSAIEAMDSAQIARNIARGQGFTTQFIRPLSIALLEQHNGPSPKYLREAHPDLANAPVYPLLLAGFMKILPFHWTMEGARFWRFQPEVIIGWFNQLLFFASLFLLFRLTQRLFDRTVASLAVVLMALTELYWEFTTSGLSTTLLIFLFLVLVQCLVSFEEGARSGLKTKLWLSSMAVGAGLVVGAMTMSRYSMGWLLIPVSLYIGFVGVGARTQTAVAAITACVLVCVPWLARNYQVSGTLLGTAGFAIHEGTITFPGHILQRSMPRNITLELNKIDLDQYPKKLFLNGREILASALPEAAGSWITALFVASVLIPFRNPGLSRLKYFLLGTLAVYLFVQALGKTELSTDSPKINSENLLVIFTPLFFLFGSGLFYILLDQIELPAPWFRSLIISSSVVILSLPMIFKLLPPRTSPISYPPYYPPMHQALAEWMRPEELIMSDLPWAVAWYGDRQSLWVTLDYGLSNRDDFYRINDEYKAIKAVYLTEITTDAKFLTQMRLADSNPQAREGIWGKFYLDAVVMKDIPNGFPLRTAPPSILPHVLFLSDTEARWSKPWVNLQKKKQ
jgi:hypothetical protein